MQIEISLSYDDWHLAKINLPNSRQAIALYIGTEREAFDGISSKYNIGYLHCKSPMTMNLDVPCTATPEQILAFIAPNKLDESIDDKMVLAAIRMMQEAIENGEL